MKYCKKCVQPDTRPGIYFNDEGICGACLHQENVNLNIDWEQRQNEILEIASWAKSVAKGPYDCVIGVSGGKDSTFQAIYARDKLGLRPLLVNSEPEGITEIGRHNIENLINLGFDTIKLRPNPKIMKQLIRKDFYRYLNPVKVTEYSLWASAFIIMDTMNIPLIIQGENPGLTLGVSKKTGTGGNSLNANEQDTISKNYLTEYLLDGIDPKDLFLFNYNRKSIENKNFKGIWLNYYTKDWSQPGNAKFSVQRGLKFKPKDIDFHTIGTYKRYSQLDSELVQVNQMLKYIKFGFGQASDHANYDIRENLITRNEGIALIHEFDGKCGESYIKQFCDYIEISVNEFWRVANSFRGKMWEKDKNGNWRIVDSIFEQEHGWKNIDISYIIERERNFENL